MLGDVAGISADFDNTIIHSGTIVVGSGDPLGFTVARGIDVFDGNTITITSTGRITAGDAAVGIRADFDNVITNNGIIRVGAGSTGVELGSDNHFTNNGTVRAGAFGFSVVACASARRTIRWSTTARSTVRSRSRGRAIASPTTA